MPHQIIAGDRSAVLDIGDLTPDQGLALASSAAALLMRSGMLAQGAVLTGPHLMQFMDELAEQLEQRREEKLVEALDAVHYYVDASDGEIAEAGTTRGDALTRARDLREEVDPYDVRTLRWSAQREKAG